MNKIFIEHYCNPKCTPLESITRLSKDEAFILAGKISKIEGRSSNRFVNFEKYYIKRIKTEKWLYDTFLSLGGNPNNSHPIYFVLNENNEINEYFGNGTIIKIPLEEINEKDICFTFGDSTAEIDNPNREKPFLKNELYEHIKFYDNDVNKFLKIIKEKYFYIEAQLWSDKYLYDYK
jgi:hypothetical protein